jgi:pimeloyl-ACP methyl ester carboxylesterase
VRPTSVPEPFTIRIEDAVLSDLDRRLAQARLPADFANDDWRYGTNGAYLAELVRYWRAEYDWRGQESAMMAFAHFRATIGGLPIHFIHERAGRPDAIPLVLSHGWPWTFWDLHKVIRPLAHPEEFGGRAEDAFDVVVPSLPGYGFSSPVTEPGINFERTADLWRELMIEVLGYPRFGAHGGDWGAKISAQLGHKYAEDVVGIHLTTVNSLALWNGDRPWALFERALAGKSGEERERLLERERHGATHLAVNILDPQSMAYAMNDSPVGLCAWLIERRRAWSDCGGDLERRFSKDELITSVMIPWVTETFGTSMRFYREANAFGWRPTHDRRPIVEAPTAVSVFLPDAPEPDVPGWWSRYFNLTYVNTHPAGGHFAPAEEPDAVIEDLRAAFRPLRANWTRRP